MVLDDGIGVRPHRRAGRLERAPQLLDLLPAALGARRDEDVHGDAARGCRPELVEDRLVVAAEERQRDLTARLANHVDDRGTALLRHRDQTIGGRDGGRRHARSRFGCFHATPLTPAPATSASIGDASRRSPTGISVAGRRGRDYTRLPRWRPRYVIIRNHYGV